MKAYFLVGVFLCAALSLTIVGIVLWPSTSQPSTSQPSTSQPSTNTAVPAVEANGFNRGSDTVVGNETPFRPEW